VLSGPRHLPALPTLRDRCRGRLGGGSKGPAARGAEKLPSSSSRPRQRLADASSRPGASSSAGTSTPAAGLDSSTRTSTPVPGLDSSAGASTPAGARSVALSPAIAPGPNPSCAAAACPSRPPAPKVWSREKRGRGAEEKGAGEKRCEVGWGRWG
jgi:hypothetical protein